MTTRGNFYRVVDEAIADFAENGFDSQERLDKWLLRLTQAAEASLIPESVLQRELVAVLTRSFKRATSPGAIKRVHRGVSQFTLTNVKPHLRRELDRAILASASLIKLNRVNSVNRTLARFAGWATSIPAGGSRIVDKPEERHNVRKAMAGLPFIERRVIIDQGHKLIAAVNRVIAVDGGAIAGVWHHADEDAPGYDPRPIHLKWSREHKLYLIRGSWALTQGLIKLDGHEYTDEIEEPGELVYCRCWYEYVYNIRDLPEDCVTAKGRAEMIRVQKIIAGMM